MGITIRNGNFRADVYHNGKRMRKTFDNLVDAEAWMGVARQALKNGQPVPLPNSGSTTTKNTFKTMADRTFNLWWKNRSQPVKKQQMIDHLVDYFGSRTLVEDITYERISDFILYCSKELGNENGTINRKLSTISKILKQARKERKISYMPDIDKLEESNGRKRWLTKEEAKEIIATANWMGKTNLEHGIIISLDTGCRASELIRIQRQDITKAGLIIPTRKSRKVPTMIPLTKRARYILDVRSRMVKGDRLFPYADGWYRDGFDELKKQNRLRHLDLTEVVWHTLRHSTCSWLVQGGINLLNVQKIMGHSNISTTMRYVHLAPMNSAEYISPLEE